MPKLKYASGQEAEFLRKALGSQPVATRWFEIVPVKVRQWTFHLSSPVTVCQVRHVEHKVTNMFLLVQKMRLPKVPLYIPLKRMVMSWSLKALAVHLNSGAL